LILAGKEIKKLSFGKKENKTLPILRRTLRESRLVEAVAGLIAAILRSLPTAIEFA
jgi:hypothetical protein